MAVCPYIEGRERDTRNHILYSKLFDYIVPVHNGLSWFTMDSPGS